MSCRASSVFPPSSLFFLFFFLSFFNSAELEVEASVMAPWRHEIMRVRESKVITIKTLGLNQKHISHFKRWERNANTGLRYSCFTAELNPLTAFFIFYFYHTWGLFVEQHCLKSYSIFVERLISASFLIYCNYNFICSWKCQRRVEKLYCNTMLWQK